jgi:hypothetical protein
MGAGRFAVIPPSVPGGNFQTSQTSLKMRVFRNFCAYFARR